MIRPMEPADFPVVFMMMNELFLESGYVPRYSWSDDKVNRFLENATVFVAVDERGPYGYVACFTAEMPFGTDTYAYEFGVYVKPEKRGGSAAKGLVRALEKWARDKGAKFISLGIATGINPKRTAKLYERLGYALFETTHRKYLE